MACLFYIIPLLGATFIRVSSDQTKDLHLIVLLPLSGDVFPVGKAFVPALRWAVDTVHATEDVLPGYRLVMHVDDSVVSLFVDCDIGHYDIWTIVW